MPKQYLFAVLTVAALVVLSVALSPITSTLERQVLNAKYSLRGPVEADTNVVILYFDNDDIAALGGSNLKRNYYALLTDVLTQVGSSAVGIEVFFGERHAEYPEYDELLARTMEKSRKVVLSSYFRQTNTQPGPLRNDALPERLRYPAEMPGVQGEHLQLPLQDFLQHAAGIGHTNLSEQSESDIPLFVMSNGASVAAFPVELLRVYAGASQQSVLAAGGAVSFGERSLVHIPHGSDGMAHIAFPGPLSSFRAYRCVEVLRSFQLQRAGRALSFDLSLLKDKIVLVGIIGEGRSKFIASPYEQSFPAIALHAAFIDNALQNRFLVETGALLGGLVAFILALAGVYFTVRLGESKGILSVVLLFLVYAAGSYLAFVSWSVSLPLVQPLFVMLVAAVLTVLYEHRTVINKVAALESEKALVESELRARELKVQSLERELLDESVKKDEQREVRLTEEINRYRADIQELSSRVTDLVQYELADAQQAEGVGEYESILYDRSGKMSEVVQLIEKIAASDANVLILGESGTGKELVAKATHNKSNRKSKPFVAINCGAIPETLLESELFGHEKGAFTGAVQEKMGRFEYADGGTIFLDEVAETSEAFQVKLLRVVQQGEFERVGSSTTRKVNVRILAATNKDVKTLLKEKRFREDLYYRLNVFTVQLPSLRERKGDIPLLTNYFVKREGEQLSVSSTVMDMFLQYHWPGNVRELESSVQRAAILTKADRRSLIRMKDISDDIAKVLEGKVSLEDQILELLRDKKFSRSSISETAQELGGMHRSTVAEYFRGSCFRYFLENAWEIDRAVQQIASTKHSETKSRVRRKLTEYLHNAVEGVQNGVPFEEIQPKLKPKYKNLPQRYHPVLDEVVRAYLQGKWVLDAKELQNSEPQH
ncbi:MAG TPA: sigma 54-interacting transcriptional regulator [Bacteroidota bacterium]